MNCSNYSGSDWYPHMYTPDDAVEATLDEVKDELQSILIYMDEYINNVEAVIATNKDEMGVDLVKKYEDDIEYVIEVVRKHKRKIKDNIKEVDIRLFCILIY